MSFYRATITWQSENGLWNLGAFSVVEDRGEYDTEYDYHSFRLVFTGKKTPDEAINAYVRDQGNAGSYEMADYVPENYASIAKWEHMAKHPNPNWIGPYAVPSH